MIPMCNGGFLMKEEDGEGEKRAIHSNKNKEFESVSFDDLI